MNHTRRSLVLLFGLTLSSALFAQTPPPVAPAPVADLAGKWQFVFETEGDPRIFEADLKLDGKTVSGTWDKKSEVKGTFSDGKLEMEFPVNSDEVGPGTLKVIGKLTDVLTGSWSFQTYAGNFKATRIKPTTDKAPER